MVIVAITGSLGTGKSTVAKMFARMGASLIDADAIVHRELKESGACFAPVMKAFGSEVVKNGRLNRQALASIVFKDAVKRRRLERIIHPVVKKRIKEGLAELAEQGRKVAVIDIPLLFESGFDKDVDFAVVVKSNRTKQLQRATRQLKISRADAIRRIKAQMPIKEKIRRADMIIDNNGTLTQTRKQVEKLWQKIRQTIKK